MKKITLICLAALVTAFAMTGCKGKSTKTTTGSNDSVKAETTSDSTIYGVCGDVCQHLVNCVHFNKLLVIFRYVCFDFAFHHFIGI